MLQNVTILGAKRSVGTLDDGTPYDSTKIYVQTKMKDTADQVGFSSVEYNWGKSPNYETLRNLTFPVKAQVDFDIETNGKTSKTIVVDVVIEKPALKA